MERARAKRIATAIIGVAFAANYCEPAAAQTPSRFIRQPAKSPAAPPATRQSDNDELRSNSPTTTTPAPASPAADAPGKTIEDPKTITVNQPFATPASETEKTSGKASPTSTDPKVTKPKPAESLSFPSLLSLTDAPNLEFDSLDSFATVPEMPLETPVKLEPKAAIHVDTLKLEPSIETNRTDPANTTRLTASRSNQLQWTARANPGVSRSEPNTTSNSRSSEPSQSQFNTDTGRSPVTFNSRSNTGSMNTGSYYTGSQFTNTSHDFQSATAAKQQADTANELLNRIATRVDAIESKFEKAAEPAEKDRIRASLVSAHITNDPRFASQSSAQSAVTRIESPQGWQSIGTRLSEHVAKCESLLRRGAFCSAREEAEAASMLLFRHIDLHDNLFRCEPAVQSANQALREAEDFLVALKSTADGDSLRRLVDAHETPVLKNKNLAGMSPLTAAQHYRQYAEAQLVEAAQGHPWASELLYTVGRTYQAEADSDGRRVDVLRMKAMAYYRASRTTMPSNAIACNQLGYLLLQMDRNDEAREALVAAVQLKSDEAFLSNLAEASRRLGDMQTVAWAAQSVAAIRRRMPAPSPVPPYVEVSQEDFIAISPREIGPKPHGESNPNAGSQSTALSATAPNASQLR